MIEILLFISINFITNSIFKTLPLDCCFDLSFSKPNSQFSCIFLETFWPLDTVGGLGMSSERHQKTHDSTFSTTFFVRIHQDNSLPLLLLLEFWIISQTFLEILLGIFSFHKQNNKRLTEVQLEQILLNNFEDKVATLSSSSWSHL